MAEYEEEEFQRQFIRSSREEIIGAIGPLRDGVSREDLFKELDELAETYLARREGEKAIPTKTQAQQDMRRLTEALNSLDPWLRDVMNNVLKKKDQVLKI